MTKDRRFPACERLRKPGDFDIVIRTGQFFRHPLLTVVVADGGTDHRRVGISVGKRVGGAVLRNRVKRRLRALYAELRELLPPACDCVIIVKPEAARATASSLREATERTFTGAGRRRPSGRRSAKRGSAP